MTTTETSYIICIPSYKRSKICNEKTLQTLADNNIASQRIIVFVANEKEKEIYEQDLDKKKYEKIVVGKKGVVQQHEFIENQYPTGQHIIFMDDDISEVDLSLSLQFNKSTLHAFFLNAFRECHKKQSFIWGVYAVYNPFFREQRTEISYSLNFLVGAFYGIINRPHLTDIKLTVTRKTNQKEDVERSIKYFMYDGIVVRFNRIGFKTKYYNNDGGGCGTFETRLAPMKRASILLKKKFPNYGYIKTRKNGMSEFVLKKIAPHNKTRKIH
jgi:hypothetical protein